MGSSDTIAIMVHEAFRDGAPILAWILVKKLQHRYNVVVLLSAGGRLFTVFEEEAAAVVSLPQAMEGGPARVSCLIGDHPPESLPHVLHALGRVLPLAAAKGEFRYAITFAPGSKR
jgi:hypothetical protein